VISEGGAALGHVEEFYVDTATGKITAFEVSGAPGEGFLKGKAVLPAEEVRTIGKDILIVRNGAEESLTRSESRLAESMKSLKDGTNRLVQKVRDIHIPGEEKEPSEPASQAPGAQEPEPPQKEQNGSEAKEAVPPVHLP
jgi:sporulation protein YlmC with PRC-barrel domain